MGYSRRDGSWLREGAEWNDHPAWTDENWGSESVNRRANNFGLALTFLGCALVVALLLLMAWTLGGGPLFWWIISAGGTR